MNRIKPPEIVSFNQVEWSSLSDIDEDYGSKLLDEYDLSNDAYFVFELETLKNESDGNKDILDFLNQCDPTKKILLSVCW
jgi:hypothetical protein